MNTSQDNHFAPPQAAVADTPDRVAAGELGGRGQRLAASILDGILGIGLAVAVAWLIDVDLMNQDAAPPAKLAALYLLFMGLFALLQARFLHTRSATLGKMALGLRIMRTDGSHAGLGRTLGLRIMLMWALTLIPLVGALIGLIDCLMIFGESRRCLHDRIADTVVVKA